MNSATSITVTPAASPALSGQKYGILVSDIISVDGLAQAMSQLIKEYDENIGAWETFVTTSANQNITVMINGTPVTIPGIGKLAQKGTNGALPIDQGGTGATTAEGSRTNLGLGTSATKNTGTTSNDVMQPGMFGLGRPDGALIFNTTSQDDLLVGLTGYGLT
ncbi:phage tail protein, partial [Enterobacter hormaechei subsp. hoffmannii]